jgi:uncharacterized membrane protein SirB2
MDASVPVEPARPEPVMVQPRSRLFRVTPLGVFAAAFLLLLAGALAILLAQTRANSLAPWLSMGFSAAAVVCVVAALVLSRRR